MVNDHGELNANLNLDIQGKNSKSRQISKFWVVVISTMNMLLTLQTSMEFIPSKYKQFTN